jgi:hypothetical protein
MTNPENTKDPTNLYRDPEWARIIPDPQSRVIEFDPMVSRLTREDRETLLKRFTDSASYKAQTVLAGSLLCLALLFIFFMGFAFLATGNIATEKNFVFFIAVFLIVWISLTIAIFRLFARRMNRFIRKLEYKKQVMFIETQVDILAYGHTPIPVKEIHVWEYVSDRPEQVTYGVHNNTRISKNTRDGDLIYRYSNTPDSSPRSLSFFVSQNHFG